MATDQTRNLQLRAIIRAALQAIPESTDAEAKCLHEIVTAAQDEIIVSNRPLAKKIAGNWLWKGPAPAPNYDEMESYALEGLWRASRRIHAATHNDLGKYLGVWIRGAILRRAVQNHPLHKFHRKRKGTVRKVFFEQYRPTKDATAPDEHAAIDLWHTIQAACQDDTDQQIVKLRRQNESYTSIAAILGIAKSTVSDRLKNIENRMNLPNTP